MFPPTSSTKHKQQVITNTSDQPAKSWGFLIRPPYIKFTQQAYLQNSWNYQIYWVSAKDITKDIDEQADNEKYKTRYMGRDTELTSSLRVCHAPGTCMYLAIRKLSGACPFGVLWKLYYVGLTDYSIWSTFSSFFLPRG